MKMERSSWENKINDVKYIEKIRLLCWAPCIIYSKQTEKKVRSCTSESLALSEPQTIFSSKQHGNNQYDVTR